MSSGVLTTKNSEEGDEVHPDQDRNRIQQAADEITQHQRAASCLRYWRQAGHTRAMTASRQQAERPVGRPIPFRLPLLSQLGIDAPILERVVGHQIRLNVADPGMLQAEALGDEAEQPGRIVAQDGRHLVDDGLPFAGRWAWLSCA